MPRDDIALRSQEYALQTRQPVEAANDRMQRSLEGLGQSFLGVQQMIRQRQQDMIANQVAASDMALGQVRQNQAIEELQWSRELHTTAMLEAQRRQATALADLAVAKAQTEQQRIAMGPAAYGVSADDMDAMMAEGFGWDYTTGTPTRASPERMEAARRRRDSRYIDRQAQAEAARNRPRATSVTALNAAITAIEGEIESAGRLPESTDQEKALKRASLAELNAERVKLRKRITRLAESAGTEKSVGQQIIEALYGEPDK